LHRFEATKVLLRHLKDEPVVANLGPTSNDLWHAERRERNLYTYGSMGLCSSIALGIALSTEERVISLDGDGSLLMNMGTLATIARERPKNLVVVVWDNEEWGQTGHQPSHTATGTDLEGVAAASGIPRTRTVRTLEELDLVFQEALHEDGPWCIVAKIEETEPLPHAPVEPELTLHRFRATYRTAV
jgi:sulfopyruvate decarboxylase subunit beta